MRIESIQFTNYRCFGNTSRIPLGSFSVLIGRNDGGKSSCLLGLHKILQGNALDDEDHRLIGPEAGDGDSQRATELQCELVLTGSDSETLQLRVTHSLGAQNNKYELLVPCVDDIGLNCDLDVLKLDDLRALATSRNIAITGPGNRRESFITGIRDYRNGLPTRLDWRESAFQSLKSKLPLSYLYFEESDPNPEHAIRNFLQTHYRNQLLAKHIEQLGEIRSEIEVALNKEASNIVPVLQEHCDTGAVPERGNRARA